MATQAEIFFRTRKWQYRIYKIYCRRGIICKILFIIDHYWNFFVQIIFETSFESFLPFYFFSLSFAFCSLSVFVFPISPLDFFLTQQSTINFVVLTSSSVGYRLRFFKPCASIVVHNYNATGYKLHITQFVINLEYFITSVNHVNFGRLSLNKTFSTFQTYTLLACSKDFTFRLSEIHFYFHSPV